MARADSSAKPAPAQWHALTIDQIRQIVSGSDLQAGLISQEAVVRLACFGPNEPGSGPHPRNTSATVAAPPAA